jgi:two-component system sensor histidine kinase QseC
VLAHGQPVACPQREFDLLHALMLNAGRVLSREQLEQQLYSWGQRGRQQCGGGAHPPPAPQAGRRLIQTVRGVGYVLLRDKASDVMRLPAKSRCRAACWRWCWAWCVAVWAGHGRGHLGRRARHELDELLDGHLAQAAACWWCSKPEIDDDDQAMDAPPAAPLRAKVAFQVFHEGPADALRSPTRPAQPHGGYEAPRGFAGRLSYVRMDGAAGACSPPMAPSATCRCMWASS